MAFHFPSRYATLVAVPTVAAAAVFAANPAQAAGGYEGFAFAVGGHLDLLGQEVVPETAMPTAEYPDGGDESLIQTPDELDPLLEAQLLNASSNVTDGVLTSKASTASVDVADGAITAEVLSATCTADGADLSGSSKLVHLTIGDQEVPVEVPPNTKMALPDELADFGIEGGIILNEQTHEDGGIQVNALHAVASLTVSSDSLGDFQIPSSLPTELQKMIADGLKNAAAKQAASPKQTLEVLDAELIISHVECYPGEEPSPSEPSSEPPSELGDQPRPTTLELPDTGASGSTVGLGAAGLLLMTAGGAALYVTRRRGRHAG